jgi:phosphoenolpyruvate carboxykinase (ATP)
MKLAYTRAMVRAILDGSLAQVQAHPDPVFGVLVPESCPGVPSEVLQPRGTWADKEAYDAQARKLAGMFVENFKQFQDKVSAEVQGAGPKVG